MFTFYLQFFTFDMKLFFWDFLALAMSVKFGKARSQFLIAKFTLIWLLSTVNSQMPGQALSFSKNFATFQTFMKVPVPEIRL